MKPLLPRQAEFRLYHLEYCGACFVVRRAAKKLGIRLELVDTYSDTKARDSLFDRLGRGQVPVLGISTAKGETLLPESSDIIDYLKRYVEERGTSPHEP